MSFFKSNMNAQDRFARLFMAFVFLISAYLFESWAFLGASVFVLIEVAFKWCALYQLLGINHCPLNKD